MRAGKELIVASKAFAKEDRRQSWRETLITIVAMAASFAGTLAPIHFAFRLLFSLTGALLLVRFFIIYHDYLHGTILKNSTFANIIFTLFGLYILAPRSIWKRSHDYHHKHNSKLHTSSIGSFPIATTRGFRRMSNAGRVNYLFIRHPLTIFFGYIFAFLWGMCLLSLWRSPDKHWDSALALIVHFGIGAAVFLGLGWEAALFAFFVPSFLASALGSYLFYAQHNFPAAQFVSKDDWTYHGAALNSSSYMKMNTVMAWFTANIGYHHVHHLNARIPFYRLPEAMKAFPELQNPGTTSLSPADVFRCLNLKVWDPQAGKMLTRSELRATLNASA